MAMAREAHAAAPELTYVPLFICLESTHVDKRISNPIPDNSLIHEDKIYGGDFTQKLQQLNNIVKYI